MRMPRTALVPTVALGCLGLFLLLSVFCADQAAGDLRSDSRGDSTTSSRYVDSVTYYDVPPGSEMVLTLPYKGSAEPAFPYARLLVLQGGDGDRLKQGGQPQDIVWEGRLPQDLSARFTRGAIPAGTPHAQGWNGDLHDAVDLVLFVERPAGMSSSTWARVSEAASRIDISSGSFPPHVQVARQPWIGMQYAWYVGTFASLAVAVVGLVGLARRRPPAPDDGADLAALVVVQGRALDFLRSLRATMATAGAILAVGGAGGLVALNAMTEWTYYDPFDGWLFFIMGFGFLTYFLALAVWLIQYRRVAREYKRWVSSPPPVDV